MHTKRLGDMLLEAGLITEEQLGEALKYQAQEKERLGTTLVKHNYITEKQLIDTLRIQLGIEYIDLSKVDITPEMSRYVPKPGEKYYPDSPVLRRGWKRRKDPGTEPIRPSKIGLQRILSKKIKEYQYAAHQPGNYNIHPNDHIHPGLLSRKLCGLRGGTASFRRVSGCRAVPL